MRILVVEDELLIAGDLRQALEAMGHSVAAQLPADGDVLRAVAEARPDLVLLDIHLRGELDGVETAQRIRARHGVPVVFLTAHADHEAVRQAALSEPLGYLVKPLNARELRVTLELAAYKLQMERRLRDSEARLATTLRSIGDAVIATDTAGHVTFINPAAARLVGLGPEGAVGRELGAVLRLVDTGTGEPLADLTARAIAAGESVTLAQPARLIAADGTERLVADSAAPLIADSGAVTGAVIVLHDVTAQQRAEAAQRRRTLEVTALSELAGDLLRCGSPEEAYAVIARAARRLFPGDAGALYIRRAGAPALQPVVAWGAVASVGGQLHDGNCWALQHGRLHTPLEPQRACACTGAPERPQRSYCVPLMAEAEILGLLHIQIDGAQPAPDDPEEGQRRSRLALAVAEHAALGLANIRLRETLREQAIRDPLTGLYNRRYLEATLERELRRAARNHYPVGIIVLDIDHFKHYNDAYGHDAGDTVLRALGIFLLGSVRADDIVCRFGGEEFVLVLPSAPQAAALARAEQICAGARGLRVSHQERSLGPITVSLGVTTLPEEELSFAAALARADAALYEAKRGGRDRAVLYGYDGAGPL